MRIFKRALVATAVVMLFVIIIFSALVGRNDMNTWQYVQYLNGTTHVQNSFGWYWKGLASVTTYPEVLQIYGTKASIPESPADDSARVDFNDGGYADIDWYARIRLPKPTFGPDETDEQRAKIEEQQRAFHRMFRSPENAVSAVRSHVRDCVNKTGNLMSASENQASRKAEFYSVAYGQFRDGFYEMKKVTIRRKGLTDLVHQVESASVVGAIAKSTTQPAKINNRGQSVVQQGEQVMGEQSIEASETVRASEIVYGKDGKPMVTTPSPLSTYGMVVLQFSIIHTEYDPGTMEKFKAKRKLLLETETARATAVQAVQDRLKNVAEGDKAIAESEALANQEMARKVIAAQIIQEVEGVKKKQREVEGQTKVLVAEVMGKQLEAERQKAVFDAQGAENARKAAEISAQAKEQMIALGGAVTDAEKTLQEIYTEQTKAVATGLPGIQVPDTVIIALDQVPAGINPLEMALPSLQFLRAAGLLEPLKETITVKWEAGKAGAAPKIELPKVAPAAPPAAK